jgi:UDP-glucose 4-epimerase
VHLAAAVGVRLIVEQPLRSFTNNVRGSQVVVEAAHRHGCQVLLASSSEIYGRNPAVPLVETAGSVFGSPAVSRWAYGVAKAVDEVLASTYHREEGLRAVVVRLFNTVGPRQSPAYGMVVPRLVRQAVRGEPLTVYGDGAQTRCFCHVADAIDGFFRLLALPAAAGQVFNLGGEEEVSILNLAHRVIELAGSSSEIQLIPYEQAYPRGFEDLRRRVPDTTRLRALTGWAPTRTLEEILTEAIREVEAEEAAMLPSA